MTLRMDYGIATTDELQELCFDSLRKEAIKVSTSNQLYMLIDVNIDLSEKLVETPPHAFDRENCTKL